MIAFPADIFEDRHEYHVPPCPHYRSDGWRFATHEAEDVSGRKNIRAPLQFRSHFPR